MWESTGLPPAMTRPVVSGVKVGDRRRHSVMGRVGEELWLKLLWMAGRGSCILPRNQTKAHRGEQGSSAGKRQAFDGWGNVTLPCRFSRPPLASSSSSCKIGLTSQSRRIRRLWRSFVIKHGPWFHRGLRHRLFALSSASMPRHIGIVGRVSRRGCAWAGASRCDCDDGTRME